MENQFTTQNKNRFVRVAPQVYEKNRIRTIKLNKSQFLKTFYSFCLAAFLTSIAGTSFSQIQKEIQKSDQRENKPRKEVKWVNSDIKDISGLSHHVLQSKAMGHEVGYVVWTPPGYSEQAMKEYPVIYFLHGAGGNESADAAGFSGWALKAIEDVTLPASICVFPNGGMSGYKGDVENMIIKELIPLIDKNYKTIGKAESRALAGFSMGGAGSVYLSMMHPELFCAVGTMGGRVGRQLGDQGLGGLSDEINKALPVWKNNNYGFFMVNGDKDKSDAFTEFSALLNENGIDNKVVVLSDTNHNLGLYYERSVSKLLAFIGKHLKK